MVLADFSRQNGKVSVIKTYDELSKFLLLGSGKQMDESEVSSKDEQEGVDNFLKAVSKSKNVSVKCNIDRNMCVNEISSFMKAVGHEKDMVEKVMKSLNDQTVYVANKGLSYYIQERAKRLLGGLSEKETEQRNTASPQIEQCQELLKLLIMFNNEKLEMDSNFKFENQSEAINILNDAYDATKSNMDNRKITIDYDRDYIKETERLGLSLSKESKKWLQNKPEAAYAVNRGFLLNKIAEGKVELAKFTMDSSEFRLNSAEIEVLRNGLYNKTVDGIELNPREKALQLALNLYNDEPRLIELFAKMNYGFSLNTDAVLQYQFLDDKVKAKDSNIKSNFPALMDIRTMNPQQLAAYRISKLNQLLRESSGEFIDRFGFIGQKCNLAKGISAQEEFEFDLMLQIFDARKKSSKIFLEQETPGEGFQLLTKLYLGITNSKDEFALWENLKSIRHELEFVDKSPEIANKYVLLSRELEASKTKQISREKQIKLWNEMKEMLGYFINHKYKNIY